jgi:phage tail-like protein
MPDLTTTSVFVLEVDGQQLGSFRKCSGIENESEIIEYKEVTKEGRMIIRKIPGSQKWSDITLERRVDTDKGLWEWRKQVLDGDIDTARFHRREELQDGGGRALEHHQLLAGQVDRR